jgi:hypothetical protein
MTVLPARFSGALFLFINEEVFALSQKLLESAIPRLDAYCDDNHLMVLR